MSKHRIFNPNDTSPEINLSVAAKMTPSRGGIHPALLNSKTVQQAAEKHIPSAQNAISSKTIDKSEPDSAGNGQDSDSDPMEVPGFFSKSNIKLPYTKEEDELILKYVLKGQNIYKVTSISLWKHLEAKKEKPKRTYQSLKNRFLRNIKPYLFTTYGYLIKDKTTTERILSKFPELKQQIGRRETLPKIKLPERNPLPKPVEDDRVSSTSSQNNVGVNSVHNDTPVSVVHSEQFQSEPNEPKSINSDSFKSVFYPRIVKANSEGIKVSVNFTVKKIVETPSVKIFEKFRRLERKNKLIFCSTCGRYNRPKKVSPLKSSKESDVLIPNSVETPQQPLKSSVRTNLDSKLRNRNRKGTKPRKLYTGGEPSCQSPCSPSLLSGVGESDVTSDKCASNNKIVQTTAVSNSVSLRKNASDNKAAQVAHSDPLKGIVGNSETSQTSNFVTSRKTENSKKAALMSNSTGKKTASSESDNKRVRTATVLTPSSKKQDTPSRTGKRRRDSDEDIDSICEDAMANFRKLIDYEEEQQLVRKCLNKNFKSVGLEGLSQTNWDSYFLDSSSDMDTPPLTIDYETDTQNNENNKLLESTSESSLTRNMRKMLEANKKS